MAGKSKWVDVSSPEQPLAEVASRAIGDRLQLVSRYLNRASQGAPTDTENVHQLRVSTRRAVAAMETFDALLPPRRKEWMHRKLKHVRKAAGDARDLDVLLERFRELAETTPAEDRWVALAHALKVREQRAQEPIDRIQSRLGKKNFKRRIRGLVKRIRPRGKEDRASNPLYAAAGQTAVELLVKDFFHAGDADFSDFAVLHQFRIHGKQLRYVMEIFAAAFEPAFRTELYPLVAGIQEHLGGVNDHATAHTIFAEWSAEEDVEEPLRSLLISLAANEEQAMHAARQEFLDWWTPDRRDELRKRFADVLGMDVADLQPPTPDLALRENA